MVGSRTFSYVRVGLISLACVCLAPLTLNGASAATGADAVWKKAGADEGLRQAFKRAIYALKDSGHGTWRGVNAAQRLTLEFNGSEARLSHPDGNVNFRLTGYGYGDRLRQPAPARLTGTGNRIEYQRGDLTEWYVNGSQGLEQGFNLAQRPGTDREGQPLAITLGVSGGLLPAQRTDDGSVVFESGKGAVLRYAGLKAVDAHGRIFPSRLEVRGSEIRLIVEDRDAQYPLVVDPMVVGATWTQQQELTASDGAAGDYFGLTVSVSGDTAVIGAPLKNSNQGTAYVFVRSGGAWSQQQELTASDGFASSSFGNSVSVSGDTAVIGAPNANGDGTAYVFVRTGGVWSQQQELTASDGAADDFFGISVSLSGDTAVIGASKNGPHGVAYVFVRSGTAWTQQQELTALDGAADDDFGYSVSVSGNTAVIGAHYKTINSNANQGAAYVFVRSGVVWTQQQELTASDGASGDQFGLSVSVSGDTAVIGAWAKNFTQGAAYVFVASATGVWSQQAELTASDGASSDEFGWSVSLSGDTAVIGSIKTINSQTDQGAAYVFVRSGGVWTQQQELTASDGAAGNSFSFSVSVSGDTMMIGSPYKNTWHGAAYAFVRPRLGTNALLVGSAGGTSSVVLSYDAAWTATSNASFLHISSGSASGTSSAVVVFTYDAFTGTGSRTGTLTIAGLTVTVTQAGANYIGPFGSAITLASGMTQPGEVAVDGSGNVYLALPQSGAITEWSASAQQTTPLVSSGLNLPYGVAVDGSGNVYIADTNDVMLKEWNPSAQQLTTLVGPEEFAGNPPLLVSPGLLDPPFGLALDVSGNVYISPQANTYITEWSPSTLQLSLFEWQGVGDLGGVAVDVAGNLYVSDQTNNAIYQSSAATQQLTTLVSSGLNGPWGVAVDGSGNVYIADNAANSVYEWIAATQQVTTLASSGLVAAPYGVAVDGSGNVYFGSFGLQELPYAFVGPASLTEPASAGTDSLLPVIPSTAPLTGVYAPTSDSSWLSIGTIANGVVSFSFTANTSTSRVGHIMVLGQQITVTQNGAPTVVSSTPSSGAGTSQTFTFLFSDPAGYAAISEAMFDIYSTSGTGPQCLGYYNAAANAVYLMNDAQNAWLGPLALNSTGSAQNSQCTLNSAGSSVTGSGNNLSWVVPLTFEAAFDGTKAISLYAASGSLTSSWVQAATWTVP